MSGLLNGRTNGDRVQWLNDMGEDRALNDLVAIGPLVGLLVRGGERGAESEVQLEGVASVPKAFGAIQRGTVVDFDASTRIAKAGTNLSKGDVRGFAVAVADAGKADHEVVVRLTPGRGVVK